MAIELLGALVPWRTLVLTAGAFPRGMDDIDVQPTRTAVRHDWRLHHLVRTVRPELARRLVSGDYFVEHACSANTAPVRQPGPGWSLLRYTTPDGFLIARAPTRGLDHVSRVRAQARWIVEHTASVNSAIPATPKVSAGCETARTVTARRAPAMPRRGSERAIRSTWTSSAGW
ncbi:beta family protein [Streptomyces sp. NPDC001076]